MMTADEIDSIIRLQNAQVISTITRYEDIGHLLDWSRYKRTTLM